MRPELRRAAILFSFAVAVLFAARPIPADAAGSCGTFVPAQPFVQSGDGDESGIGGTGLHDARPNRITSLGDDSESGIGGTGILGTITSLDRLCVNGLEIRVSAGVLSQSVKDGAGGPLAIGQVAWIRAQQGPDGLVAEEIQIQSPLAGSVESLANDGQTFVIAGQTVRLPEEVSRGPGLATDSPRIGEWVVVHGLRDPEDRLIASRIEANPNRRTRVGARFLAAALLEDRPLHALSIEGYIAHDREGPRLAGLRLELAPTFVGTERETLRPGWHLTAVGRLSKTGAFLVERTVTFGRPPRTGPIDRKTTMPPEKKHRSDNTSPAGGPDKAPSDSPPRTKTNRPRPQSIERRLDRRPEIPDIERPRSRPQIDRPTGLERSRPE